MRYFNVEQFKEPKSMYYGKIDISELEKTAKEITEAEAKQRPRWGSGNISVDEEGNWHWVATDFDTSG